MMVVAELAAGDKRNETDRKKERRRSGTRKESEEGRDGGGSGCSGQVKKAHSRRETSTGKGKKLREGDREEFLPKKQF